MTNSEEIYQPEEVPPQPEDVDDNEVEASEDTQANLNDTKDTQLQLDDVDGDEADEDTQVSQVDTQDTQQVEEAQLLLDDEASSDIQVNQAGIKNRG